MRVDINPVPNADAIRPQAGRQLLEPAPVPPSVRGHPAPAAQRDGAGVEVEADPSLSAASPPFDAERVAQVRRALEDGSYPVVPTQIADAMIAARFMLSLTR